MPAVLNRKVADRIVPVDDVRGARHRARARAEGRDLLRHLLRRARSRPRSKSPKTRPKGSVILAMLPDTGERYLSTFLFEGVNEGSDEV